jgi:hypothetical protein
MAWDLFKWIVVALLAANCLLVAGFYSKMRSDIAELKQDRTTYAQEIADARTALGKDIAGIRAGLAQAISEMRSGLARVARFRRPQTRCVP